jgi:hypothetical protein
MLKCFFYVAFFGYRDTGMDLTPYLYPEIKLFTVKTLKQIQYDKLLKCLLKCLLILKEYYSDFYYFHFKLSLRLTFNCFRSKKPLQTVTNQIHFYLIAVCS